MAAARHLSRPKPFRPRARSSPRRSPRWAACPATSSCTTTAQRPNGFPSPTHPPPAPHPCPGQPPALLNLDIIVQVSGARPNKPGVITEAAGPQDLLSVPLKTSAPAVVSAIGLSAFPGLGVGQADAALSVTLNRVTV